MAQHNDLGKLGEDLAVDYLKKKGYAILERNWRYKKAEIDIIALKNNSLIVVEVKTRSNFSVGEPYEFVNSKKIKLLIEAVNQYVEFNDYEFFVQFDIISLKKCATNFEIMHLEDAFYYF